VLVVLGARLPPADPANCRALVERSLRIEKWTREELAALERVLDEALGKLAA